MLRFAVRRLLSMILVLFAISVMTFLIFFATPGVDPAARIDDIRVLSKQGGKSGTWVR